MRARVPCALIFLNEIWEISKKDHLHFVCRSSQKNVTVPQILELSQRRILIIPAMADSNTDTASMASIPEPVVRHYSLRNCSQIYLINWKMFGYLYLGEVKTQRLHVYVCVSVLCALWASRSVYVRRIACLGIGCPASASTVQLVQCRAVKHGNFVFSTD